MKIYFALLCLIINAVVAGAATQTTINQDKPPRLYVKSYSVTHDESFEESGTLLYLYSLGWPNPYWVEGTDVFDNVHSYVESRNFQDGGAGSWSQHYHGQDTSFSLSLLSTDDEKVDISWLPCNWSNIFGTETDVLSILDLPDYVPFGYSNFVTTVTSNLYVQIPPEQCSMNLYEASTYVPTDPNAVGGLVTTVQTVKRSAQTILKFETGGKAVANNKNVYDLSGNASQIHYEQVNAIWSEALYPDAYEGWAVTSNTVVPPTDIRIGSYGNLNKNGVLYVNLAAGADVDVTPDVAGVDYCTFNLNQTEVQTKADWQKVVQYEIDNDSGVQVENYLAGNGFMTNRLNIQAVYAFYQKLFTEQPTHFYWAGLAKLAGAPVYAALSDAEHGYDWLAGMVSTNSPYDATNNLQTMASIQNLQNILIGMNIAILNDLAWQFEAYRKCGTNAIYQAWVNSGFDITVLDTNAIAAWREIDQGIQQNISTNTQAGNKVLLQREQQQVLADGYTALNTLSPIVTWGMSQFAENPVPGGPDFITLEPSGNIGNFDARWDWITHPTTGMWWLWLGTSPSTQLSWVQVPLTTRAADYTQFSPVY